MLCHDPSSKPKPPLGFSPFLQSILWTVRNSKSTRCFIRFLFRWSLKMITVPVRKPRLTYPFVTWLIKASSFKWTWPSSFGYHVLLIPRCSLLTFKAIWMPVVKNTIVMPIFKTEMIMDRKAVYLCTVWFISVLSAHSHRCKNRQLDSFANPGTNFTSKVTLNFMEVIK